MTPTPHDLGWLSEPHLRGGICRLDMDPWAGRSRHASPGASLPPVRGSRRGRSRRRAQVARRPAYRLRRHLDVVEDTPGSFSPRPERARNEFLSAQLPRDRPRGAPVVPRNERQAGRPSPAKVASPMSTAVAAVELVLLSFRRNAVASPRALPRRLGAGGRHSGPCPSARLAGRFPARCKSSGGRGNRILWDECQASLQ